MKKLFSLLLAAVLAVGLAAPVAAAESTTTDLGIDGTYTQSASGGWLLGDVNVYSPESANYSNLHAVISDNTITLKYTYNTHTFTCSLPFSGESDGVYHFSNSYSNIRLFSNPSNSSDYYIGGNAPNFTVTGGSVGIVEMEVNKEPSPTADTIATGSYTGVGSAEVNVVFGKFPIATLPLAKATITEQNLTLSFRARGLDYLFTAPRTAVDSDGTCHYSVVEGDRTWNVSITPSGALTGNVAYSGDRGTMDFTMALTKK